MFRKRSAALPAGQEGIASYTGKQQAAGRPSRPNRTYWPGALLGALIGAGCTAYYVVGLIMQAHAGQPMRTVMIDQSYVYLVVAAAIVPAYVTGKIFELLLGVVLQKHER